MKSKKKGENLKREKVITIRCRVCQMVDSYTEREKKCRHCGSPLYKIDRV